MISRQGFVSNSSSSSYVIMGVNLGYDVIEKIKPEALDKLFNTKSFVEKMQSRVKCGSNNGDLPTTFIINTIEDLKTALDDVGFPKCIDSAWFGFDLISEFDESEEDYGAGLNFLEIKGDETKDQFRQKVFDAVSKIFKIDDENEVKLYNWVATD